MSSSLSAAAAAAAAEEAATQRLLRRTFTAALPTEGVGEVDEAIVDYLVAMLLETDADADGAEEARDGSTISTADTYDDEVALEILKGYLPLEDDGAVLDARLDVTGLRAQLRGIAEEAAAERERQEQAARRTSALSLSRSRDGAEALSPPPPGSSSLTEEQEAEGRSESLAQHAARDAEALSFLEQLLPDADPEVVDFVFCIKCLCSRERAADLLLGLAGDGKALASLGEEKERYEASQREAREKERREQEAAEVAAKQAIVDRFADQVIPSASASSSIRNKSASTPIPFPALQPDSRVRYHNNEPVILPKGNVSSKYIVEKVTPDWDGGSRGRIKTKGKRGPGYM